MNIPFEQLLNHPSESHPPVLSPGRKPLYKTVSLGFPKQDTLTLGIPNRLLICFHHTQWVLEHSEEWALLASKVKPKESDKQQRPGLHPSWG